jgi:alpha-L-rhamnosidase
MRRFDEGGVVALAVAAGALLCAAASAPCAPAEVSAGSAPDALLAGFESPPAAARPRVWWHWLDGNVTREGIQLDLSWMQRAGLAGFQLFDVAYRSPHVLEKRLAYMTPEWQDAFRYAIATARRLGLDAGIASAPGWSETGGVWVAPEQAMKKVVWSETRIPGGRVFKGFLPRPPDVAGAFQDLERPGQTPEAARHFYRDTLVLAYRLPPEEQASRLLTPKVSVSGGTVDPVLLSSPQLQHAPAARLPPPTAGESSWIRFDYPQPHTIRSLVVALPDSGPFAVSARVQLEASGDGSTFRAVTDVPAAAFNEVTVSFAPVTARAFRVVFSGPLDIGDLWRRAGQSAVPGIVTPPFGLGPPPQKDYPITRLALIEGARVNRFEEQAGFGVAPDYYALAGPSVAADDAVPAANVIDLTASMRPDGSLKWRPPGGAQDWMIVRMGYSLTGQTNEPAPAEGVGLEVDKLDRNEVAAYMGHYLKTYRDTLGPDSFGHQGVTSLVTDSIEAGPQNWTGALMSEFRQRRGYDPLPYLLTLTGRIVDSCASSERFLWDFRTTIAELLAENHYGQVAASAHDAGLVVYGEALENNRPNLGDDMQMRSHADVPMGALWSPGRDGRIMPTNIVDLQGAASVAHLYGRPFVGAESLTSALQPWAAAPRDLKSSVDAELALGVTRFMLHSSVHQPLVDGAPGLTLGIFGQYFNRDDTWAEQERPWIDYLARNVYLLQQGRYYADVAYFYGEEAPLTGLYGQRYNMDAPVGYGFDYVNADALLHLLSVREGILFTPSGMRYRVLQLGGSSARMTLAVLRKLEGLVEAGAVVVGKRPVSSPGLADDPEEFRRLTDRLWGGGARVIVDRPVGEVLARLGLPPDWADTNADAPPLMVLHRTLDRGDIYFVSSRSHQSTKASVAFRVTGLVPELWDADTGTRTTLPYRVENGRTVVPLRFDPDGSALIVFRQSSSPTASAAPPAAPAVEAVATTLSQLEGNWTLQFQPGRGAPEGGMPATVGSWTDSNIPGIRYFSGTGTYTRTFDLKWSALTRKSLASGRRFVLDLGEVADIATVTLNGRKLRTLWKPPYKLDVTDAVRPGRNVVELSVTNLWVNRLIGDEQPGAVKVAHLSEPAYRADAPLRRSGLIGPVRLLEMQWSSTHVEP